VLIRPPRFLRSRLYLVALANRPWGAPTLMLRSAARSRAVPTVIDHELRSPHGGCHEGTAGIDAAAAETPTCILFEAMIRGVRRDARDRIPETKGAGNFFALFLANL